MGLASTSGAFDPHVNSTTPFVLVLSWVAWHQDNRTVIPRLHKVLACGRSRHCRMSRYVDSTALFAVLC